MRACSVLLSCPTKHRQAQVHAHLFGPYPVANGTLGTMNRLHTFEMSFPYIYEIVHISFQDSLCSEAGPGTHRITCCDCLSSARVRTSYLWRPFWDFKVVDTLRSIHSVKN